ncbi:hypothetical protein F5Y10DRAFT_250711 [Nemania abortiva]|nr:hypothetical protein F5Y10DRAFT_250711 [Nemania abortiva]
MLTPTFVAVDINVDADVTLALASSLDRKTENILCSVVVTWISYRIDSWWILSQRAPPNRYFLTFYWGSGEKQSRRGPAFGRRSMVLVLGAVLGTPSDPAGRRLLMAARVPYVDEVITVVFVFFSIITVSFPSFLVTPLRHLCYFSQCICRMLLVVRF